MFWKRKKTRLELLREAALDHAQDALETAHDVLQQASGVVHDKLENAPDKIEDLKSSAGESLGEAVARVSGAMSALGSRVGDATQTAKKSAQERLSNVSETASETAEDARDALENKRRKLEKKLAKKQRAAVEAAKDKKSEIAKKHAPEIVVQDDGQKWIWLGVGLLAGAVLGVLLAPASGRRNRALLRDKVVKGAGKAEDLGEAAARKARDLSNRADGLAHAVAEKVSGKAEGESDGADDITIADRVRTELGRVPETQGLERLNVESVNGVVTLRGPIMDEATQAAIIAAASQVQGVREVVSDLMTEDKDEEKFVG
jgi:gas vesicle protein